MVTKDSLRVKSPCATPTSSRRAKKSGTFSITSYFPVRKRGSSASPELYGKRRRRGATVLDAEFLSPEGILPHATPLRYRCFGDQDEQQAGSSQEAAVGRNIVRSSTALGIFEDLPPGLFQLMIDNLDIPCLISLGLSSSAWNAHVLNYVHSNLFLQRVLRESSEFVNNGFNSIENFFTSVDPFYHYGKLLKSVSVCFPTSKRIATLMHFCDRVLAYEEIDKFGVGRTIHTMCSKWAFPECAKVLQAVLKRNNNRLQNALKRMASSEAGSMPAVEMELRENLRPLLLSGQSAEYDGADIEYMFWLSAVMHTVKEPIAQSKLLMIMFGPAKCDGREITIDWHLFCEHVIAPFNLTETLLKPLADVLYLLLKTKKLENEKYLWSQHDVFNIIEELTTTPEPWSFDNFVALLLHQTSLIPVSLIARMNHDYADEACLMFLSFMTTAYRWNINVCEAIQQPILQTMRGLTRQRGRQFYDCICDQYANMLKQLSSRGQDAAVELNILLAAHAQAAPLLREMSTLLW